MWKWLVTFALLLLLSVYLWAKAHSWNTFHYQLSAPVISPNGLYYAQVFEVPDGEPKAYGSGVYIGYRLIPPWLSSTLVFAAYCRDETLNWVSAQKLHVSCRTSDDPILLPAPADIVVEFSPRS
jgi:hypothetical protein